MKITVSFEQRNSKIDIQEKNPRLNKFTEQKAFYKAFLFFI